MPIRIVESAEPLSPAAQVDGKESLLIDSDAGRLLSHEMLRYCQGEITGRSFLIAGHRGAGKTTMVSNSYLQASRETTRNSGSNRPLIVWLHGPSLFPEERTAEVPPSGQVKPGVITPNGANGAVTVTVNTAAPAGSDAAQRAMPVKPNESAIALEQITLSLHRAVAREFATSFQRIVESRIESESGEGSWGYTQPRAPTGFWQQILRGTNKASTGELLELAELSASFERELYESPDDSRLRDYWRRARALRRGVLRTRTGRYGSPEGNAQSFTQGSLELVALSGISQAYRRISGKYEMLEALKDEAQAKSDASFGIDSSSGKLFAPILSLLAGGLVGTGVLASADASGPVATISGILAALGASLVFKASSSRSRTATASREEKFIFDLSATTLDRILPILVERLRRAGIAPIFVVDELDKVDQLSRRILGMVHHLKKFVAENAFFCFLTDRTYFERLSQRSAALAYPVEYTYYTHLIFVSFTTRDFHEYLSGRPALGDQPARAGILQLVADPPGTRPPAATAATPSVAADASPSAPSAPAPAAQQPPNAPATAAEVQPTVTPTTTGDDQAVAPQPGPVQGASTGAAPVGPSPAAPATPAAEVPIAAQSTTSADELDLEVLPYFLLHRAQLHPLDLKRQLSSLRNPAGNLMLRRGQVRGEGYRLDVQMQVAIEILLDREAIRAYLMRDPDDRRLAHDAMYYLTRQWKKEEELIDLSDAGKDAFSTYLSDRIGTEGVLPESVKRATPPDATAATLDIERMEVADTERDFLLSGVRSLAELLSDHDVFERYLDGWNLDRTAAGQPPIGGGVRDTLQLKRSPPLLRRVGAADSRMYRWNYDRAGLELAIPPGEAGAAATAAPPLSDIDADIAFIRAFALALESL